MTKKPEFPAAVDDPPREDEESQPFKGGKKRSSQPELPGVVDNLHALPAVTRAMKRLKEARGEFQEAGTRCQKVRDDLVALMRKHEIKTYVAAGLKVTIEPGEEKVRIKDLTSPDENE